MKFKTNTPARAKKKIEVKSLIVDALLCRKRIVGLRSLPNRRYRRWPAMGECKLSYKK